MENGSLRHRSRAAGEIIRDGSSTGVGGNGLFGLAGSDHVQLDVAGAAGVLVDELVSGPGHDFGAFGLSAYLGDGEVFA